MTLASSLAQETHSLLRKTLQHGRRCEARVGAIDSVLHALVVVVGGIGHTTAAAVQERRWARAVGGPYEVVLFPRHTAPHHHQ